MPVAGQKGLTAGHLAADDSLVDPPLNRRTGLPDGCPASLVAQEGLHQNDAYLIFWPKTGLPDREKQLYRLARAAQNLYNNSRNG